ncbi:hypothetical protein [Streptomyces hesseae]|uniref:DUF5134 domain-containing protein n=1 Tax=Streptomyces hesseae TaxID=3075519 RepID=A0ABU2SW03_9ACTN|nr:hypothetical protein [Streptomyces sp. DSM 40473]MDT0452040.1 hypothetical protein [Streptomyces sp. DSM 40473]
MQPPSVSYSAWWLVSAVVTVAFVAFFVPLMPDVRKKLRVCSGPVLMAMLFAASTVIHWTEARVALPMYCCMMLAAIISGVGRRPVIRQWSLAPENATSGDFHMSWGMRVQVVLAVVAMTLLMIWLCAG